MLMRTAGMELIARKRKAQIAILIAALVGSGCAMLSGALAAPARSHAVVQVSEGIADVAPDLS